MKIFRLPGSAMSIRTKFQMVRHRLQLAKNATAKIRPRAKFRGTVSSALYLVLGTALKLKLVFREVYFAVRPVSTAIWLYSAAFGHAGPSTHPIIANVARLSETPAMFRLCALGTGPPATIDTPTTQ
jgi:hypothetical protein